MTLTNLHSRTLSVKIAATLGLSLLAVAGNILNLPLFYGVDFVFGSIAVMLAVALLGTYPAVFVAIAGGLYTLVLWGHPYACVIFTLEAFVVGQLYQRNLFTLLWADVIYWLTIGVALILLLYHNALDMDWHASTLIALKQPLNGLFNTLLAGLILLGLQFSVPKLRLPSPHLSDLLFHTLLSTILISGGISIIYENHDLRSHEETIIEEHMLDHADRITNIINTTHTPTDDTGNLQKLLTKENFETDLSLGLISNDGQVIFSQGEIASAGAPASQLIPKSRHLSIWLPPDNLSTMQRWKQGKYLVSIPLTHNDFFSRIIIEKSAESLVLKLENRRMFLLLILSVILGLGLLISRTLSHWLSRPIRKLELASRNLPLQIASGVPISLPESSIHEYASLTATIKDMADRLTSNFQLLQQQQNSLEEQVKSRTEELHESKEHFAFAVESAGDGIWDWDINTNAVQFSPLWMTMLGYEPNELPPHFNTYTMLLHPDDKFSFQQSIDSYLAGNSSTFTIEARLLCKDGSFKWVLSRGQLVQLNHHEKPHRMIGIHTDITQQKQTENNLIVARDEAELANNAKSDFLSSMSHELRTPMNAILGFSQLLQSEDDLSEHHRSDVEEIVKAGEHLLELINEVLDLAKIEAGHAEISLQAISVHSVIDKCMSMLTSLANNYEIKLEYTRQQSTFIVMADEIRLTQALINLLSNAIKYNHKGGSVKVELQPQEDTGYLRIMITDTGPGIAPEALDVIFQPFNRSTAEKSNIQGTGIGLTITQRIVEMMDGKVGVDSDVGVGSRFWIELPLAHAPDTDNPIKLSEK